MKNILKRIQAVLAISVLMFSATSVALQQTVLAYGGGDGTVGSPYQIENCTDLENVDNNMTAAYILTMSLDCSASGNAAGIGSEGNDFFTGDFDGGGFSVTLDIDKGMFDQAGLFYRAGTGANIHDVTVEGTITGNWSTGGLIGLASSAIVSGCISNATINGGDKVGGLIGYADNSTITESSSSAGVTASADNVGGLIGSLYHGSVSGSSATGQVDGANSVGGLVGSIDTADLTDVYAEGVVNGNTSVGGLVGYFTNSSNTSKIFHAHATGAVNVTYSGGGLVGEMLGGVISQSYATGDVTSNGGDDIGGFIGRAVEGVITIRDSYARGAANMTIGESTAGSFLGYGGEQVVIYNSYATGAITTDAIDYGGLFGNGSSESVYNSFWDSETTGATNMCDQPGCTGAGSRSTIQMKTTTTFTDATWDFDTIWSRVDGTNNGYPYLLGGADQTYTPPEVPQEVGEDATITNCEQLQAINGLETTYSATYTLGNDIDCTMTNPESSNFDPEGTWGDGYGFAPIGFFGPDFEGQFDGAGHKITGLFINREEDNGVGLFSTTTDNAYIHDLYLVNATVTGYGETGTLVGSSYGNIENVTVSTDLVGYGSYVAGLVGYAYTGDFSNVHVMGSVHAEQDEGGGIIGQYDGGTLEDCSFSGAIESYYESGGIIGENEGEVLISRCYSEGSITAGDTDTGGLVGEVEDNIIISESFSTMDVLGEDAGGLVGTVVSGDMLLVNSFFNGTVGNTGDVGLIIGYVGSSNIATVQNTYGTGTVTSVDNAMGFTGRPGPSNQYSNSFWNTETSGKDYGCSPSLCDGVAGKTTSQLKDINTFTTEQGEGAWNFEDVWVLDSTLNDGYPCLKWAINVCSGDYDLDGTPDADENAGPNSGDANGDGLLDRRQSNITSLVNTVTNNYSVLESSCTTNTTTTISAESDTHKDAAYSYASGLMNFTMTGCDATATITQFNFGNYDASKLVARKYNPTNHSYSTINGAVLTYTTVGGLSALKTVYQVEDNGPLDLSPEVGTITDPSGAGLLILGTPNTGFSR